MCGIAGALSLRHGQFRLDAQYLIRMRETMKHRGPDSSGVWVADDQIVGMAHRRLSIIDLSSDASQPMHGQSGHLTVVFNGEIYNHIELRAELEQLGHHRWGTDHSDTEVILEAFEEWGIDCLSRFRGMFAFALWDNRSQDLWLVRDRLGIKPLYHTSHHGKFAFASEIKALLADPELRPEVDEVSLYHYLTFLVAPAPGTLFRGISKLPPAHWMRVRPDGSVRIERYWDALDSPSGRDVTEAEGASLLLKAFEDSVRIRKLSDVPVGVFLSGGIDSSANAAMFSRGESKPIQTFSIGYEGASGTRVDESRQAWEAAAHLGTNHHLRMTNKDELLAVLPKIVHHQDEPLADPVCVPYYLVAEEAHKFGTTVCHVGEGADELFFGYPAWQRYLLAQRLSNRLMPKALRPIVALLAGAWPKKRGLIYELANRGSAGRPLFWSGASAFTEAEKRALLSQDVLGRVAGIDSFDIVGPVRDRFLDRASQPNIINWMSYMDLNVRLPELLLMRLDKMSMASSVECRVPFLDHDFVQLAMSLPSELKLKNGNTKHILKQALRGVIPDWIIDRPKQGFGVPLDEWFGEGLRERATEDITAFVEQSGLVGLQPAQSLLEKGDSARVWVVWNLAIWWLQQIGKGPTRTTEAIED